MRRLFFAGLAILAVVAVFAQAAWAQDSYVGEVTGNRVNIRAGTGTNYRILRVAHKGDNVIVLAQKGEWLKIECPSDCKVWVSAEYVGDGVITGNAVKVRATSSARDTALATLAKGTPVQVVEEKGDWVRIVPPKSAVAWIFGKYVKRVGTVASIERGRAVKDLFDELEVTLAEEKASRELVNWNIDLLLEGYEHVKVLMRKEDSGDMSRTIAARTESRITELKKLKDVQRKLAAAEEAIENAKKESKEKKESLNNEPSYTAKGWVEDMGMVIGRPGTHKLKMGGKELYILKSNRHNLYDYVGSLVGIFGQVCEAPAGWNIMVIDVEKIDILHEQKESQF